MMEFLLELPLPPNELSSNVRVHWTRRAKATKRYRRDCYYAARAARPKNWPAEAQVTLDVEYRAFRGCGGYHPKDVQNAIAALKSGIDGLVDAGVARSDAARWLQWGAFKLISTARAAHHRAGVLMTVRCA